MKSLLRCMALFLAALTAQMTMAQAVVRVPPPPPPRNAGVIGRPPHPGFVWTPGFQRWNGRRYQWVPGRWVRPPRRGAVWVEPAWNRRGNGWVFSNGFWR
jgi:hypothetical protein